VRLRLCVGIYSAVALWAAFFLVLCGAAPAGAASIGLAWDPSSDRVVAGYRIHYGDQPGHYTKTVQVKGRLTSSAVIDGLEEGKAYFFAVTAYSANGKESAYSPEISNIKPSPKKIPVSKRVAKTPEGKILPSKGRRGDAVTR
jgi:hypothetical protein